MLVDEGSSIWLYLTADDFKVQSDCWVQNLVPAPIDLSGFTENDSPPPATREFAALEAMQPIPDPADIEFRWSDDGRSVAVAYRSVPMGFIDHSIQRGFSKFIIKPGPFGMPFDFKRYDSLFPRNWAV